MLRLCAKGRRRLSREIVTNLLRDEFKFDGLIMTDDLDMGAILNEYGLEETIRLAIEAGNDLAMICHRVASIDEVHRTLGKLPPAQIERALESVACARKQSCRRRMNSRNPPLRRSTRASGICGSRSWAKKRPPGEAPRMANARPLKRTDPSGAFIDPDKPRLPSHLQALDGLRGVACLAVVAHHCYYSAGRYTWPFGLPKLFSYGYLGVEIFFVLSGFCLSYPLLKHPDRPDDWARYARHRVRRIFPPYWAAYLLFFALGLLIHWQQIEPLVQARLLPVPSFRQFLYTFPLIAVWFNPAFWTLLVEVRWYAALPFCVKIARKIGVGPLLLLSVIGSAAFAMLEGQLSGRLQLVFAKLPLFLPLFVMGIALAAFYVRRPVKIPFMACAGQPGRSGRGDRSHVLANTGPPGEQTLIFIELFRVDCSHPA